MNILVRIKRVPDTAEIKIDPVTDTLIRDGVPSIVNPFDECALETAARIKNANLDTKIVVVSVGPNQATNALRGCPAITTGKAYPVSDQAFGGSDTLATSYILSHTIRKVEEAEGKFDVIFCGKQAIDGDTAQVGPEIAKHLGLLQVTYVLEAEAKENTFRVLKEGPDHNMMTGVTMPCLITFIKPGSNPRYLSIKKKMAANHAVIPVLTAADLLDIDLTRTELKGSPTEVKEPFCPKRKKDGVTIKEDSGQASAAKLAQAFSTACLV